MDKSPKGTLQALSERVTAWFDQIRSQQKPGAKPVSGIVDAYLAKGLASINDLLSRLRGKK